MFEPGPGPRVFAQAPGVDFPQALVEGLRARCTDLPPHAKARGHLVVNTRRMARRIREIFDAGPPALLPRISLVTDLSALGATPEAEQISPLRRKLVLTQLVMRLLDQQPELASRAAAYDLADSLAELLDEMDGEGVSPDEIAALDVSDMSGHWERAKTFINIIQQVQSDEAQVEGGQAQQRRDVLRLMAQWADQPPEHPIIVAGSTGSRGATLMLMQAVARLPQGAVVLPGFDFDLHPSVWSHMDDSLTAEDHPQFRFRRLMAELDISAGDIRPWHGTQAPAPARNAALSLALRPAPVTHAWMTEGGDLRDIDSAFADVTLVEAPSLREEALAIAMRLRQAAEDGITAALISPDRMLTRQVTAALQRWNIQPDDSAGTPLQLTPPGRFLRHVAGLYQRRLTSDQLLTLLKHPLTHTDAQRGEHLRNTRELELYLRKEGIPFPDAGAIRAGAVKRGITSEGWTNWVIACFTDAQTMGEHSLAHWVRQVEERAEQIAGGGTGSGALWDEKEGREARALIDTLSREAPHGGDMGASDFANLLGALLSGGQVREADAVHPRIMIWGTLEARVQGAELLILGGLNEGVWPEAFKPDPWLNRQMRRCAGLPLPDRKIGLSAHDFQQAIAAPKVWLTRAIRSDDAQTVPSRWINRLTNLLDGLPDGRGARALRDMRDRGDIWLGWAKALEATVPVPAAPRPSPKPPLAARPRQLSVTEIKRLIRDPYAIYARHVLRLRPLDPLVRLPDPRAKGIVLHDVLDRYIAALAKGDARLDADSYLAMAKATLDETIPWPTARLMWLGQLARHADWFLATEADRQSRAQFLKAEVKARRQLDDLGFTLTARADRVDQDEAGRLHLFDYKTGLPPSAPQQLKFDKQLLLTAALAEDGAFDGIPAAPVERAVFIGVTQAKESRAPIETETPDKIWAEFRRLIAAYQDDAVGYTSRRMLEKDTNVGDYDHLARFGEWDDTSPSNPEVLE